MEYSQYSHATWMEQLQVTSNTQPLLSDEQTARVALFKRALALNIRAKRAASSYIADCRMKQARGFLMQDISLSKLTSLSQSFDVRSKVFYKFTHLKNDSGSGSVQAAVSLYAPFCGQRTRMMGLAQNQGCQMAKFDPSTLAPSTLAQSRERKGSNFAA